MPDYAKHEFDSMLVINGTILKTGFQLPFPTGGDVKAFDLKKAVVFAGFTDAHVHFVQTAITKTACDFSRISSLSEIFELVEEAVKNKPIVLGFSLQEFNLKEKRLPTLSELNKISSEKIIWLSRKDLHSAVLNSAAINWARKIFPDLKHEDGFLKGSYYNELAYRLIDEIPDSAIIDGMKKTANDCYQNGVTCIHALEGSLESVREAELAATFLKREPLEGVVYHQSFNPDFAKKHSYPGLGGCLLVDGSLGTRTAALNQPYQDNPDESGILYLTPEKIESLLKTARKEKLQVALHAIGDRAIDLVSSCYLWAYEKFGKQSLPDRIEHLVLPEEKAIKAIRKSGSFVCIQPLFDYLWGGPDRLYAQRLGKERASRCNPFKTLLDLGIPLACGSDSPVTPIDPLLCVHALVNHSNSDESVNLNSALSMNITAPYEMIGKTKTRGQLKTGFKADFVCLSEDPFLVLQSKLREIEVNATYINGLPVFNLQT